MEEILKRFVEWVNDHGGPSPVAISIGKTPQSFYNYTNRGSKPNMEIFALLANQYEDFDATYILTGKSHINDQREEVESLRHQIKIKDATIAKIVMPNFKKGVTHCPGKVNSRMATAIAVVRTAHTTRRKVAVAEKPYLGHTLGLDLRRWISNNN